MVKYFLKTKENILNEFNTSLEGLSSEQISENKTKYGYNELEREEKKSFVHIFINQFKDFLVIVLIFAGILSVFTGNIESSIVIFAVITMNAILGTIQHMKAEASLESLKKLSSPMAKVIRNKEILEIPSREVVVGDIVLLEAGDIVPADGRVISFSSLMVNESSLTGESESVEKTNFVLKDENLSLGDQKNMVFSGSLVTYGRGTIVITAIGMESEIGKIAKLIKQTEEKVTPLQVSLDKFGRNLSIAILILCAFVFSINIYHGSGVMDSLLFAVALAVAAIPEALSSIVTIILAIGTQKMSKENAIIKKLKAVEGLGSVSVICSDKTGTLTQNKMTAKNIFVNNLLKDTEDIDTKNLIENKLLVFSCLCSDAISSGSNEIGDPTETALTSLASKFNLRETSLRKKYPRLSEIPFDSSRKLMSTLCEINDENIMITKGALDVLLKRSKFINVFGEVREISHEDISLIEKTNFDLSSKGLRVLAFGYKVLGSNNFIDFSFEKDFIFLGLISMIDPPRKESKGAVRDCINAGIKPIMITGDHKITASSIAKEIGILKEGDLAITGSELSKLTDSEFSKKIEDISVYARVSPSDKIRIVSMWQKKGNICAMTGDGVNDAPALKKADIGIAMGITGTEVSKDAASMILADDNFATIIKAIVTGRNIYTNIKNSIRFLLSGNMAGILAVLYASTFNLPMPFAPVHLLFINLLTDSLPAIAIGMEPDENDILKEKPRNINEPILNKDLSLKILLEGGLIAFFTLLSFHIGIKTSSYAGMTMAFATLCLARLFHGFNCRGKYSLFTLKIKSNMFSVYAFVIGAFLLNLLLFNDIIGSMFKVASLYSLQIIYVYILAFIPTLIIQICRYIKYDRKKNKS